MDSKEKFKLNSKKEFSISYIMFLITLILMGIGMKVYQFEKQTLIEFVFMAFYLVFAFLVAEKDKRNRNIDKYVLYYGIVISCIYIVFLCILKESFLSTGMAYILALIATLIIDSSIQLKKAKNSYLMSVIILIIIQSIFTGIVITAISLAIALVSIGIVGLYYYTKNKMNKYIKTNENFFKEVKIGYIVSFSNILIYIGFLLVNYLFF